MPVDLSNPPMLYVALGVLLLAAVVARRVPVLRTIVSLVIWGGLAVVLVTVLNQRERFDPYVGRVAEALNLDSQSVSGTETRIRMAGDGHFWVNVTLDGVTRRMLVDSGATITALSTSTAAAAGLEPKAAMFPVLLRTANGTISAQTADVGELRLGNVVARDLPVVVSPAFGETNVLGMNFLSKLKSWRVEERTLILVPHHPQEV